MFDTGSTGFMLVCTMLVLLMTPGLAFFYGGLSRRKNVGNTMLMVFASLGIAALVWMACGWSFAYGGDGSSAVFGGFDQLFLQGVTADVFAEAQEAPADAVYPGIADVAFQAAFCMITTAITPAAGFVEPWAAAVMGFAGSPCCYFAISVCKKRFGYDDALDAFGCHCVGGVLGGILTGVFCVPELSWTDYGGLVYTGSFDLLGAQLLGIAVTVLFVGALDLALAFLVKRAFSCELRVAEAEEAQGLDVSVHGESAYPAYVGLD